MPADTPGKPRASPLAGAPASASRTPNEPRSAAEPRKSSKPVMEKRRRARINESLAQLKTLILDALRKESSRHSKLEKADILEMTVRHLQSLRRVQVTAALSADPAVLGKYRAGFNECLAEVNRFLVGCEGVPADVRSRLLGHLAACLGQLGPPLRPVPPSLVAEALATCCVLALQYSDTRNQPGSHCPAVPGLPSLLLAAMLQETRGSGLSHTAETELSHPEPS
uniref:Transcription factor HES-4 n=1 Tax=Sus scrofa TaxID=9823 RepID=A0A8D0NH13_PIG